MTTPWEKFEAGGASFPSLGSLAGSSGAGKPASSFAGLFSGGGGGGGGAGSATTSSGYRPNQSLTPTWAGGSTAPTWGGSPIPPGMRSPTPAAAPRTSSTSSGMTMPNGFSSALFAQPKQAAASGGGSYTSPAALTAANSKATNGSRVSQGGVAYTPLANSNTTPTGGAPPLPTTASNPAPGSVATSRDQYGREFNYASSVNSGDGSVVGVSANGTVLKKTSAGQVYDTGATATAPRVAVATAPKVATTTAPRVATPTGVLVKRSQPTVSSGPTPEDIEKQRRDSGYYLQ